MAEKNVVDFIEEWQTGAFLIVLSVVSGAVLLFGFGFVLPLSPIAILSVFLGGITVAFVVLSYIMYGR
ncbi:hypothetical protein [Natronorubrum halophilum]|uniref:hypothetical protein n=1 Tax=Natronorubrum halophilum TaxID=1702106 RepID=UPI0010C22017|nr:hypothetical protein [Natronorubrum halophilum]